MQALLDSHRQNSADVVPDFQPDLSTVYRIQKAVSDQLGPVLGYKVAADAQNTGHWLVAPMHRRFKDAASIDAKLSRQRGVELEIGWVVINDPPAPSHPHFEQIITDCVAPCTAIEIVETRLADSEKAGPMWRLADNQRNAGWVSAEPIASWSSVDLCLPVVYLTIGSRCIMNGPASVPGGDAFASLVGCARKVYDQGKALRTGQVVITGSLTGLEWADAGDMIIGKIQGLGSVSVQFSREP